MDADSDSEDESDSDSDFDDNESDNDSDFGDGASDLEGPGGTVAVKREEAGRSPQVDFTVVQPPARNRPVEDCSITLAQASHHSGPHLLISV